MTPDDITAFPGTEPQNKEELITALQSQVLALQKELDLATQRIEELDGEIALLDSDPPNSGENKTSRPTADELFKLENDLFYLFESKGQDLNNRDKAKAALAIIFPA